jgi:hypothetical protein
MHDFLQQLTTQNWLQIFVTVWILIAGLAAGRRRF